MAAVVESVVVLAVREAVLAVLAALEDTPGTLPGKLYGHQRHVWRGYNTQRAGHTWQADY